MHPTKMTENAMRCFALACKVVKVEPEKAAIAAVALVAKPQRSPSRRFMNVVRVDGPAATADRALALLCGGEEREAGVALGTAAMRKYMRYLGTVASAHVQELLEQQCAPCSHAPPSPSSPPSSPSPPTMLTRATLSPSAPQLALRRQGHSARSTWWGRSVIRQR